MKRREIDMNIFFPYPKVIESVQSLDDKRLLKQILECKVIVNEWHRKQDPSHDPGIKIKGYANHPVIMHYSSCHSNYWLAMKYGLQCCIEYGYRFGKAHAYDFLFYKELNETIRYMTENNIILGAKPIYVEKEYSTTDPEKLYGLFRQKLHQKWKDGRSAPKWTKREVPSFYLKGE